MLKSDPYLRFLGLCNLEIWRKKIQEELHSGEQWLAKWVKIINLLIKYSFNDLYLPWTNLAYILAQDTSLPSFIKIPEELHPGER